VRGECAVDGGLERLLGDGLAGSEGRSQQGAGNLPLELTLEQDGTLAGLLESSPVSLRRYP